MTDARTRAYWRVIAAFVAAVLIGLAMFLLYLRTGSIAQCVNNVLGSRNPSSVRVNTAQRAFAAADAAYNHAEVGIFTVPKPQATAFFQATFLPALRAKSAASDALNAALAEQARVQQAHPLGSC